MAEPIKATNDEVILTDESRVACDGPEFSKHPRVYLTLDDNVEGEVVCPYCSRVFRKTHL